MISTFARLSVFLIASGLMAAGVRGLAAQPQTSAIPVKAYTGFRLIDGTSRGPVDNAVLVVRGGRVVAAGPAASVSVPAGAERLALTGKTVTPGLINAHGHVTNAATELRTYAVHGVTTVVSLGGEDAAT